MRRQPVDQRADDRRGLGFVEQVGTIGAEQGRQRAGDPHGMLGAFGRLARHPAGEVGERPALGRELRLADVEGHERIGVGGDDLRAGLDEAPMRLGNSLRRQHESQRRPFRLLERRAHAVQLAAHAAVEDGETFSHGVLSRIEFWGFPLPDLPHVGGGV